jgi:VanZ family protein
VRVLLVLVVLIILYGTLYPFDFDFERTLESPVWILFHSWPEQFDRFALRDALTNVFLYLPLGFVATLAFGRRWPLAILLGAGLSASVEMLQVYDATRTCSLADLSFNIAGGGIGAIVAMATPATILRRPIDRLRSGPAIVTACWAGYLFYPFLPLLSRGNLHRAWIQFLATPLFPVEIAGATAEWFAAALLVEAVAGRVSAAWFAPALLAFPVRLLLIDRNLAPAEICGFVLALLLWATIPSGRRGLIAIPLMAAAILLRQLAPFRFAADAAPFSWIPFATSIDADRVPAAVVMLRKAFDYGAMVWLARGIGLMRAGIIVAVTLFITEWIQRYLPGRQPEITDALVALIMTGILAWSRRR